MTIPSSYLADTPDVPVGEAERVDIGCQHIVDIWRFGAVVFDEYQIRVTLAGNT